MLIIKRNDLNVKPIEEVDKKPVFGSAVGIEAAKKSVR